MQSQEVRAGPRDSGPAYCSAMPSSFGERIAKAADEVQETVTGPHWPGPFGLLFGAVPRGAKTRFEPDVTVRREGAYRAVFRRLPTGFEVRVGFSYWVVGFLVGFVVVSAGLAIWIPIPVARLVFGGLGTFGIALGGLVIFKGLRHERSLGPTLRYDRSERAIRKRSGSISIADIERIEFVRFLVIRKFPDDENRLSLEPMSYLLAKIRHDSDPARYIMLDYDRGGLGRVGRRIAQAIDRPFQRTHLGVYRHTLSHWKDLAVRSRKKR